MAYTKIHFDTWQRSKSMTASEDMYENYIERIRLNIKYLMSRRHGLTLVAIENDMRQNGLVMSKTWLSEFLNGKRERLYLEVLCNLARFFGVTIKELLFEDLTNKYI